MSISSIAAFVLPYIRLNQIRIYYGEGTLPGAYMVWAYLTDRSLEKAVEDPSALLDIEDINAGEHLYVVDIVSRLRTISPVLADIRVLAAGKAAVYAPRFSRVTGKLEVRCFPVARVWDK